MENEGGVKMNGDNQIPGMQNPYLSPYYITAQMNFIFRARMLWRDLATWLMAYMVSLYGGVGNTEALSNRLYNVPIEYGNILRSYFGEQITGEYMNLIVQYIALLQSFFVAQINNDVNLMNSLTQQIYQNVDTSADFLAKINPYWSKSEWVSLLSAFTSTHIEEARTLLTQNYERNVDIFDRILAQTNIIGDYFSQGLTYYFTLNQPLQPQLAP